MQVLAGTSTGYQYLTCEWIIAEFCKCLGRGVGGPVHLAPLPVREIELPHIIVIIGIGRFLVPPTKQEQLVHIGIYDQPGAPSITWCGGEAEELIEHLAHRVERVHITVN